MNLLRALHPRSIRAGSLWQSHCQHLAVRNASKLAQVEELDATSAIRVTWEDGFSARFHKKWLRDHCTCGACQHPDTLQRQIDTASIDANPSCQVAIKDMLDREDNALGINWKDLIKGSTCQSSSFDSTWLRHHAYSEPETRASISDLHQPTLNGKALWDSSLTIPSHPYASVANDIYPVMSDLHIYGVVLVKDTPSSMDETERFSRQIGFILETIYGTMWTTNPQNDDQSYNDTASTNMELLHHTDGTYMREPPGLQIFNCIAQAGTGGDSLYTDGFHVAEKLRAQHPDAFELLTTVPLRYHSFDDGTHLTTLEPLIKLDYQGNVVQFRHNDYDRAPLTYLSFDQISKFYDAHEKIMAILRDESMGVSVRLGVGDMVLVDNQRVMHGRRAFEGGERSLIGCYIGRNEYESRLRTLGIL